jgi:hypothetical protein
MSRGYRISWNPSATAVARATDRAELGVELLGVLPEAEMKQRLRAELESAGWERQADGSLARAFGQAAATLSADASSVHLEIAKEQTRRATKATVGAVTEEMQRRLEKELVAELSAQEGEMRAELDAAVQRTYAGALKERAARLGEIESMTEGRSADGEEEIVIKVRL